MLIMFLFLLGHGCTYQAWYEGFKARQRENCYQYKSQSEIQNCLDKVDSVTYEQYKKEREELIKNLNRIQNVL